METKWLTSIVTQICNQMGLLICSAGPPTPSLDPKITYLNENKHF